MGQKINPISLRLQYTNRNFDNCWYSSYFYKKLLIKDLFLQFYLNNFLKLVKLSSGRYSIQHFQKRTQIYNFLCYSRSTREWRLKLFGLTKKQNILKKARYFLKNKIDLKRKNKKITKLKYFYKPLNQTTIYKIQKKITSFQNYYLWSTIVKPLKSKGNFFNFNRYFLNPSLNVFNLNKFKGEQNKNELLNTNSSQKFSIISEFNLLVTNSLILNSSKLKKSLFIQKSQNINHSKTYLSNIKNYDRSFYFPMLNLKKNLINSNLFFLQNLFIYKCLKTNLTKQKIIKKNNGISVFTPVSFKYKNYLESSLSKFYNINTDLQPFKVKNDWQHANFLADEIVYLLEKRIPFRRLKGKILKQLSQIPLIRGVRITCSGRVGGKSKKAQRAKIECLKYGQTSLQVFSSKIDFAVKTAFTSFGSVGVKIWICYN